MSAQQRLLLAAGVVGPPLFVVVFLLEEATRPGYSAWRNFVSQLATGDGGWIQVANFLIDGLLMLCFAAGLRLALGRGRASIAGPALMALYGIGLLVAGTFVTDPALGYPPGAANVHTTHGLIHGLAGLATFASLAACTFVIAARFRRDPPPRRWATYSISTGLLILACFVASNVLSGLDATGHLPNAPTGLVQRISIIGGWAWVTAIALRFLRGGSAAQSG